MFMLWRRLCRLPRTTFRPSLQGNLERLLNSVFLIMYEVYGGLNNGKGIAYARCNTSRK